MPGLESLIERLVRHHVEFVVVGGFAGVAHGVSMLTQDVDICCRFTPENLLRLQDSISDLHPVHRMTRQRVALELTPTNCGRLKNLYLDTDYGQLDCLGEVMAVGNYDDALRRSVEIRLPFGPARVLTLDALITAKQAMDRPRDREMVAQLEAIRMHGRPPRNPRAVREKGPSYSARKRRRPS